MTTVDARGLACPLPLTMAKRRMAELRPGETLVVLATDPEAPIDLGAWAAAEGHGYGERRGEGHAEYVLTKAGGPVLRRGGPDDADAIAAVVHAGLASYADWYREPWEPKPREVLADGFRRRLALPGAWSLVAEEDGAIVAHVAFVQALDRYPDGAPVPGKARLWNLFVHPDRWGGGLGRALLERALDEMRAQGFRECDLDTPAGYERARRLYERAGFAPGEPTPGLDFGMPLVTYRRAL